MTAPHRIRIALVGNPNAGKSSLFNHLTGLKQKIGNYPGVTVDKRVGNITLSDGAAAHVIDLPGIYSIYPRSLDERIVAEVLLDHNSDNAIDKVVVIVDGTNLKRGLLLATQVLDMGLPTIVAVNMMDLAAKAGVSYDFVTLSARLGVPFVPINARKGEGIDQLTKKLSEPLQPAPAPILALWNDVRKPVEELRKELGVDNDYEAYQFLEQPHLLTFLNSDKTKVVEDIRRRNNFMPGRMQGIETVERYRVIQSLLEEISVKPAAHNWRSYSQKLDKILLHKVWGYVIFFALLLLIFQSIFAWATVLQDLIDVAFAELAAFVAGSLPEGAVNSLIAEGIIPGIGGIVIFVPQIAILFGFIALLEESGYMARVVFLMDRIMRKFGLNGKSVVPLMSGVACAIPAVMATRTIDNWRERITTILVTPLMSCSARLPVFTILIALVVPEQTVWGVFNLQGLTLLGLYVLGFVTALVAAWVISRLLKVRERSFLIMELPVYRWPKWSNVGYTIVEKTKSFVFEAGKVILAISIVLWVLASYGPGDTLARAEEAVSAQHPNGGLTEQEFDDAVASYKIEHSYAGIAGRAIEPLIKPLGYDWKIGIALITSFAAREVFVATMATIYSIGSVDEEDTTTIKQRLSAEINPDTGGPRFTPAVGFSLLVFYTYAMQCMSTLAVVYRETKGWKWPAIQLAYMTVLAYVSAFVVYQIMA